MRILQIVPSISLVYGGPSQMVRSLSKALADRGVDLTVVTTDSNGDSGQPPLDVPLDRPVPQDGYQVRYFRCSPFRRYKFSPKLLGWLWQNAGEFDLAHIHALFSPLSTATATVARTRQLPYILRPLGTLDPADLRKKKRLKQVYVKLLEGANIAGAAALHFTSEREAEISERFGAETRDLVIPLGVESPEPVADVGDYLNQLQVKGDETEPLILFLSRVEPKKGLELLIPALEKIWDGGGRFRFVLAGANPQDPDYDRQIRERIARSPLAGQTTLTGFVTGKAKTALLQVADLFVLPSYYENFGIAVAEAMVAGTAVAISNGVHIWPQVEQAGGGWVSNCEIDEIATMIQTALGDRDELRRRGALARDYALEHYSWGAIAEQMIGAYEDILRYRQRQ
ncbi:hormogonium polysaccharide biosynthesis glycosyltransferase HpsP [Lyngbya sp. CCY1209]|uniref:hormogonium polysaccharide biosynthesis glycosyltransferase HpsP n=1 Tax=Lyngbya sp. CCY1209 TaxID=2886103 RepID=UPI002D2121AB|nr:hormogonium polysaccharide biosynthesis glycosyltransferase HpsP [Lyngbya sp. CCY1209]MEB3886584.1 hormogonium polysaccharide biosynthesis glycosyltransferase HpsP [Lyngbya sp. CCY1209]